MSDKQLQWLQLHVSALGISHHQVVLRLIEQLYNKQGILGEVGGGGRTRSRLCDSGWHNLELYTNFTIILPLKQLIEFKI